ncbi:MAG: Hpt domain-containing protein [Planctomycetota bacterium]
MAELVEYFTGELSDRIASLTGAWQGQDREQLKRLSHQLKGAASGYGFPQITEAAAALEGGMQDAAAMADLTEAFDELVLLCRRASIQG